jgi:PAS domain S-box-containing protein
VTSELSEDKVRGYAEEIGADPDRLVAAARKLKTGSKEQFKRAVAFLETVASSISLLGLQNIQQAREITERKRAEAKLMRLSTAISISTDSVVLTDIEGKIVEMNEATLEMYGTDDEGDLIGKSSFDLLAPEEREKLFACMAELLEKGYVKRLEYYATTKSGGTRPVETSIALLRDVEGEPTGLVGITRDITERKRAEEERARLMAQIQEQAQQVQQLMDTVPEGVLLLDADGQVILANPVAEKDLSILAGAHAGDTLTHLGDRPLAELLASPPKGLWHEVATDGRRFEVIARPLETGSEAGDWVLVIRDVTQEREIQQRVQQQERLATVGQLAAGIAHDFNNIMATIILYAQMSLRAEELSSRDRGRMVTISQQAKQAADLIRQILDFGRRAVLERQPLDLAPLLKEHVKLLERTLPENIQVNLTYGPALSKVKGPDVYTVNADPTRVQQVLMNLSVNARDAMPEGGELRFGLERIRVQPRESPPLPEMEPGEWVQVTVLDTGTGIPPDMLPHIFDPFFTTKGAGKGSGLGLAQVHGIVKQHEGEVDVQSQMGRGTTFTIYLPALPVHQPEASTLEVPALAKGQGETVLVVEDNTTTRQALVESLELLNYRVLEAADGREALKILEQSPSQSPSTSSGQTPLPAGGEVALVLSDVVMPGMGGVALLHALRERGLTVKVVMLTGHPLEREMESLRAQGMSDWLPKPPRLEQLAEVVARVLNL